MSCWFSRCPACGFDLAVSFRTPLSVANRLIRPEGLSPSWLPASPALALLRKLQVVATALCCRVLVRDERPSGVGRLQRSQRGNVGPPWRVHTFQRCARRCNDFQIVQIYEGFVALVVGIKRTTQPGLRSGGDRLRVAHPKGARSGAKVVPPGACAW